MISIIIPVYNAGAYLEQCIESVLQQTYLDWELLLVDDGSTDGSREKCERYAENEPRIKVIYSERGGVSRARNAGIEVAQGEYFFFMDNDDYWKEDTLLENVMTQIEIQKAEVMMYSVISFWPNGEMSKRVKGIDVSLINSSDKATAIRYMVEKDILTRAVWTKAIHRDLFKKYNIRFPEGMRNEDVYVTGQLLLCAEKFGWCEEATYMYRKGTGVSQSDQKVSTQIIRDMQNICVEYVDNVERMPVSEELKMAYYSYIAYPFAVLMMYIGGTKDKKIKAGIKTLKEYAKVLKADYNPYVKIVRRAYRIFGFGLTIRLLVWYDRIRR